MRNIRKRNGHTVLERERERSVFFLPFRQSFMIQSCIIKIRDFSINSRSVLPYMRALVTCHKTQPKAHYCKLRTLFFLFNNLQLKTVIIIVLVIILSTVLEYLCTIEREFLYLIMVQLKMSSREQMPRGEQRKIWMTVYYRD